MKIKAHASYRNKAKDAFDFIETCLDRFNVEKIKYLQVSKGDEPDAYGVHGLCEYPDKEERRRKYRLNCYIPGPFPSEVFSLGKKDSTRENKKYTRLNNISEALVWIFGHEFYHYLCHSKLLDKKNSEKYADRWADNLLKLFRINKKL